MTARGAPRGHSRFSPVPPMPLTARPELLILAESGGSLGLALWRVAADAFLWGGAKSEDRGELFAAVDPDEARLIASAVTEGPELASAIRTIRTVREQPRQADADAVADASSVIVVWAEARDRKETALLFAELAALLQPASAARAFTAGRLSRRLGESQRAGIWYWRSARLARRANSNIDRANARLGLANLAHDLGKYPAAEAHLWKALRAALRNGRKSLAAAAYHNLIAVAYDTGRPTEALQFLKTAADYYQPDHPRFPVLAYDAGFYLLRERYFSSALLVFEKVLPWVEGQRVSILVLSACARAAAAVRDHIRFQRMSTAVLKLTAMDDEDSANALYQVAEGARSFLDWERAHELAVQALELARRREDAATISSAEALVAEIASRTPGDIDQVPPEGHPVDEITQMILKKLARRSAPPAGGGAVPPEQYPTD